MRIGMILDKTFPPDPRVENEAISLINNGHEVFLFCLKYENELSNDVHKEIQIKRYKTNRFNYKMSALVYSFPLYSFIMKKKIHHFLVTNKIDVIHVNDIQIAQATFMARKGLNCKIVLDLHENRPEIMKFYPHLTKFPGNLLISPNKWKQKEELFIKKADKIIVVTEESKQEIYNRVGIPLNNIIVVPNTVHKSFYLNTLFKGKIIDKYKNRFVVLYIGDTGIRRGLLTAIEGVSILKEKIETLKLVIVGSNSSDIILKNKVNELGLQDFVDFEGWQNESTFPSYINSSSVCISPLHKNLHHDTTYANKIFQYMSFLKPLVVSNVLAQKNIVERAKSGLVHKAECTSDFANKIMTLYNNPELGIELGANGKQFIENEFHWEKTSEKLIDLYANLKN